MGAVEIRRLEPSELELALPVWSQAFDQGDRPMEEWREMERRWGARNVTYGLFDSAGLQATVLVMDSRFQFGPDIQVPMGGLGGVACLPATRGKGYAGDTVRYALEQMKEAGQVTSLLTPFSWSFYQNLGWEWTGTRRRYSVLSRVLRPDPETEFVRAATQADRPRIFDLYTKFSGQYRGMLVRDANEWGHLLDDRKDKYAYAYLYEWDGQVEGYLVFYGWKEEETRIREFITLTPRAQRALLGLLRRHEMQVKKFAWHAPENDLLWSQFAHWDIETRLQLFQMARIVNFPAALSYLRPAADRNERVRVGIRDTNAPWNAHTWQIAIESGHVEATPTQAAPDLTMDIRHATQAYFGSPCLYDLRRAELLAVHNEAGYGVLQHLFAGLPMWTNDDF